MMAAILKNTPYKALFWSLTHHTQIHLSWIYTWLSCMQKKMQNKGVFTLVALRRWS